MLSWVRRGAWVAAMSLTVIVFVFLTIRATQDTQNLLGGTVPPDVTSPSATPSTR